jgi:hypothetical protein
VRWQAVALFVMLLVPASIGYGGRTIGLALLVVAAGTIFGLAHRSFARPPERRSTATSRS